MRQWRRDSTYNKYEESETYIFIVGLLISSIFSKRIFRCISRCQQPLVTTFWNSPKCSLIIWNFWLSFSSLGWFTSNCTCTLWSTNAEIPSSIFQIFTLITANLYYWLELSQTISKTLSINNGKPT